MKQEFKRVLIVDDDLSQLPLWKFIIQRSSKTALVSWAASAEQAKVIMNQIKSFDLIIVDLFLAGSQTGLEFLESDEVRKSNAETILVSAANRESLQKHLQNRLEKTKLIIKPLNVVTCERVLNEIIQ